VPRAIRIPSLDVRAPVVPIDAERQVLVPPSDPTAVGWWSDGARPGAVTGSAVITGHTVSTGGGAFDDLDRLHAGDRLSVLTRAGAYGYVVGEVVAYPKRSLSKHAERLFDQSVPGRLVLVTCEDWNGAVYLSNQVVVAHPASDRPRR
jgi:LPXTG-site transpeptidase (sortase) family protein